VQLKAEQIQHPVYLLPKKKSESRIATGNVKIRHIEKTEETTYPPYFASEEGKDFLESLPPAESIVEKSGHEPVVIVRSPARERRVKTPDATDMLSLSRNSTQKKQSVMIILFIIS
jgi:hypothetical protein